MYFVMMMIRMLHHRLPILLWAVTLLINIRAQKHTLFLSFSTPCYFLLLKFDAYNGRCTPSMPPSPYNIPVSLPPLSSHLYHYLPSSPLPIWRVIVADFKQRSCTQGKVSRFHPSGSYSMFTCLPTNSM